MNERIEPVTGLRAYFDDLARVAPADHALSDVLARTAGIAQRPAWQTRLPRIGRLEGVARQFPLRYALVAVATLVLAVAVASVGGPARTPFEGRWTSRDFDGSTQFLDVAGGSAPVVRFEDLRASGCESQHDDSLDFVAHGIAIISGDLLVVDYPNGGGCHTWQVPRFSVTFTLDRVRGNLVDSTGVVWTRVP